MNADTVIELGRQAMNVTVLLAAPLLLSALAAGLMIGMFQAATQIQDMTLSFIPKLVVLVVVLGIAGPWMLRQLIDYTTQLFEMIPSLVG
ncbi:MULTISPECIES: flagellar biosynthesis protein FliQ [Zhongshania]|jgi:flagellar biosynthetic protein FliQ|uniref:Flagellar biosynthetic protein FliQ n=2 Tax=Zhongshania TaxID=1434050 RepID=A0A127M6U0_9GAMM|nr:MULTISPECIES: flagellar biosynthesis protein FliQ [Zhongshania]AMO68911.1 EscS/YscS/HrcS family type III secretion system export apparatus protein [Zhongshania aliphaticivorans]EIF43437.1 flagellar biosynthetic protein FliQ [gamma proteobacterium BDW918]MBB5185997.1 flagellar biosynthetic protein FliQ [Zhongshania antarctica]|tara:strand:- start:30842 stop:31111 length:270 start_codon:yes stop_codon:yes gene_type:complete